MSSGQKKMSSKMWKLSLNYYLMTMCCICVFVYLYTYTCVSMACPLVTFCFVSLKCCMKYITLQEQPNLNIHIYWK